MSDEPLMEYMLSRSKEQLIAEIARQEGIIFRQTKYIIQLHGGEVRAAGARTSRRGRPRGSSRVSATMIFTAHRRLRGPRDRHVTQQQLATALGLESVSSLKYLLTLYGIEWPIA